MFSIVVACGHRAVAVCDQYGQSSVKVLIAAAAAVADGECQQGGLANVAGHRTEAGATFRLPPRGLFVCQAGAAHSG
jgi:hypothetical protein